MPRVFNCLLAGLLAASLTSLPSMAAAEGSARDVLFAAYQKMIDSRYVAESVSTDEKGRKVIIPAAQIAYVELGSEHTRAVGFGAVNN